VVGLHFEAFEHGGGTRVVAYGEAVLLDPPPGPP
jgi:hypothetical protein